MLSKHGKAWDEKQLGPAYSHARRIEDLVADNLISCNQGQRLLNGAAEAGIPELSSKKRKSTIAQNAARAWKHTRLKKRFWPDVYTFNAPVYDPKTKSTKESELSVWLPLELLSMIFHLGDKAVVGGVEQMDPETLKHLNHLQAKFDLPDLIGTGLHGDGIPNNYDRTESCYGVTMNLPGVGGKWGRMRLPIFVGPAAHILPETMHVLLDVIAWSYRHAQAGVNPATRHDGTPFGPGDESRAKIAGQKLDFNATLVEVRGDWDWYSKIFNFPYHNEIEGICWKCACRRDEAHPPHAMYLERGIGARWAFRIIYIDRRH